MNSISAISVKSSHETLLEKANLFLDSINLQKGDPESESSLYFQKKKNSIFSDFNESKSINSLSPALSIYKNGSETPLQLTSKLFVSRKNLNSPTKPMDFSSPQPRKRTSMKKKSSYEYLENEPNFGTSSDFEKTDSERGNKTEISSLGDAIPNKKKRNHQYFPHCSLTHWKILGSFKMKSKFDGFSSNC